MMKKKLNNKKGFTLAELLIVVAIIGILVAISIPIFTSKLGDAKEATDLANIRAAKAAAVTAVLGEEDINGDFYDAESGKFVDSKPTAYGKSSEAIDNSGATGTPSGNALKVTVSGENITLNWE